MLHKYVIFDELKDHAGFNDVDLLALITQKADGKSKKYKNSRLPKQKVSILSHSIHTYVTIAYNSCKPYSLTLFALPLIYD